METNTPQINQPLDIVAVAKKCREFNTNEILKFLQMHTYRFWCWGASAFTNIQDQALRFKVNGHLHKGYVFIVLNGADLFDIYFTDKKAVIKDIKNDVYIEDLFTILDNRIERIPKYTH